MRTLMRTIAAGAIIIGLAWSSAACTQAPNPGDQASPQAQPSLKPTTPDLGGCAEIVIDPTQLAALGANGMVNKKTPHTVVAHTAIGAGSHIGLTGEGSCLWITGNIGPNVAISVTGEGSGIVIEGVVDPSVRIDVGPGSVTWIPKLRSVFDGPDLRISSKNGGLLVINGLEEMLR